MRGRIAQGLTIAFLVSWGAAPGPAKSRSADSNTRIVKRAGEGVRPGNRPYQVGTASWYGEDFEGKPTASGEPFNMYDLTAAHPTLPLGTLVRVTNLRNRKTVVVRINDRGPIVPGRIIDLSYGAARVLNFKALGIQRVRLDLIVQKNLQMTMAVLRQPT